MRNEISEWKFWCTCSWCTSVFLIGMSAQSSHLFSRNQERQNTHGEIFQYQITWFVNISWTPAATLSTTLYHKEKSLKLILYYCIYLLYLQVTNSVHCSARIHTGQYKELVNQQANGLFTYIYILLFFHMKFKSANRGFLGGLLPRNWLVSELLNLSPFHAMNTFLSSLCFHWPSKRHLVFCLYGCFKVKFCSFKTEILPAWLMMRLAFWISSEIESLYLNTSRVNEGVLIKSGDTVPLPIWRTSFL